MYPFRLILPRRERFYIRVLRSLRECPTAGYLDRIKFPQFCLREMENEERNWSGMAIRRAWHFPYSGTYLTRGVFRSDVISRMSPATSASLCARNWTVDARPVYTQRAQHRTGAVCVAAFHRVVLRWLVDVVRGRERESTRW